MKSFLDTANSRNQLAYVNYLALNKVMANVGGSEYDFNAVKNAYDQDNAVKALIKNFDKNGISLRTDKMADQPSAKTAKPTSIDQMAKRAAKKNLNK